MPKALLEPTRPFPQVASSSSLPRPTLHRLIDWWGEETTVTWSRRIGGFGLLFVSFYALGGAGAALSIAAMIAVAYGGRPVVRRWPVQVGSAISSTVRPSALVRVFAQLSFIDAFQRSAIRKRPSRRAGLSSAVMMRIMAAVSVRFCGSAAARLRLILGPVIAARVT